MPPQRLRRLTACRDAASAAWIIAAVRDFDFTVGSIVPPVFDAYARIFHPPSRGRYGQESPVRWADVAKANRRQMHPAAEWGSITGSWAFQAQPGIWDAPPSTGGLPRQLASLLAAILSAHTSDRDQGAFGIWEGWGLGNPIFSFKKGTPDTEMQRARAAYYTEQATWRGLLDSAATFELPQRRMHLLRGPVAAIEDLYEPYAGPSSLCLRNPPSMWWPGDRRWCVGTDIDLMTTYVGGSTAAIDALLAEERLEVLRVGDDQGVDWEADTVNPLPPPPS
jgi:hypothetical protein